MSIIEKIINRIVRCILYFKIGEKMDEFILAILFIALIGFCLFVKSYFPNGCERRRNLKVLITGSTRGIGFALAKRFLELGDSVVITGRSQKSVDKALDELAMKNVFGVVCDVRDAASVQEALEFAADKLHHVDIVINNAGISYDKLAPIFDVEAETLRDVVDTNLVGSLFVAKFALQLFRKQKAGMLWLMDGAGSQGRATALFSAYGASKAAIPQLKKSLNAELKKENLPKEIGVKCCSPGMVCIFLKKKKNHYIYYYK